MGPRFPASTVTSIKTDSDSLHQSQLVLDLLLHLKPISPLSSTMAFLLFRRVVEGGPAFHMPLS